MAGRVKRRPGRTPPRRGGERRDDAATATRLRETELLLAISSTIVSTIDLREALRRVCRELTRLTGADTGSVYLVDPSGDLLVPCAAYRVPKEHLAVLAAATLPLKEQGFHLPVWRARRPVCSDDIGGDPRFSHDMFRTIPHQSGLMLPLILDGEVAGAFYLVWWTARRRFEPRELDRLGHVSDQVALLLRNARLFERAEGDRRRLEALYDVGRRLAAASGSAEILDVILKDATRLVGADAAGIRLLEGDDLVLAARTDSAAPLMIRQRIKVGESLSGRVVAEDRSIAVEDMVQDTRYDPAHRRGAVEAGVHGFLGIPLRAHGRIIGVLNVFTTRCRRFTEDETSLLSALADQAALAIDKARLYAASRQREREATSLASVTGHLASYLEVDRVLDLIASSACELLGAEASAFWRYDEGRGGFTVFRAFHFDAEQTRGMVVTLGQGLAGRVVAERRPIWLPDVVAQFERDGAPVVTTETAARLRMRGALGAPILSRDDVYGVLVVYHHQPYEFSPREVQLLSTLANQAAIAIENARLYAEAQRQRAQVTQILESTSDGIVFLALDGRVRSANRRAAELFGIPAGRADLTLAELLIREFSDPAQNKQAEAVFRALLNDPSRGGEGDLALPVQGRVLHWVAQPTVDPGGATIGLTVTFQDLTREREVVRMKSDFVSFVTHQLRTPLAGIRWMLELATQSGTSAEETAAYLRDAGDSVLRLNALVNDLLDASRLESGKLTIEPQRVALRALTDRVLNELAPLVQEKGHRVVVEEAAEDPAVPADPQMLRQVLVNLMSNAIKYTPRGGEIVISLGRRGEVVHWAIRDNGVGIPKPAQSRLFERFYRAENVLAIETEGTGLGLYMVRLILEHLGGRIWCESEEGRGARFAFELPAD